MSDDIVVAIVAGSSVVITGFCVLSAAIFSYTASNKRLDKIDATLALIQSDMREWFSPGE